VLPQVLAVHDVMERRGALAAPADAFGPRAHSGVSSFHHSPNSRSIRFIATVSPTSPTIRPVLPSTNVEVAAALHADAVAVQARVAAALDVVHSGVSFPAHASHGFRTAYGPLS
jgi:hypothetical protein